RVVGDVKLALLVLAEGVDLLVLDLRVVEGAGGVAGVDVEPVNLALAAVSLGDRRVEHLDGAGGNAGRPADVDADAVPFEQADDGIIGNLPAAVGANSDAGTLTRGSELFVSRRRHGCDSSLCV